MEKQNEEDEEIGEEDEEVSDDEDDPCAKVLFKKYF